MKAILFILSLNFCFLANAQSPLAIQRKPLALQKVSYKSRIPVAVSRVKPRIAKSCFWGTFRLKSNTPIYGIHLYNPDAKQGQKSAGFKQKQRFALDVFLMRSAKDGRITSKLINLLALDYPSRTWGVSKYAVSWTWVDSQTQKFPVFKIDVWATDGVYGEIGDNVFVSFPQGLAEKASVQSLDFGSWHASDYSAQENTLVTGVDGQTEIFVKLAPSTSELTAEQEIESYQFTLRWDAERAKFLPDENAKRVIGQFTWMNSVIEKW